MEKITFYSKAYLLITRVKAYVVYDNHTNSHLLISRKKTYVLDQDVYDTLIDRKIINSIN